MKRWIALSAVVVVGTAGAACSSLKPTAAGTCLAPSGAVSITSLRVGDGCLSTSAAVGYLWSCQTTFNGGGASVQGPWFNGDGTFNYTTKAVVDGSVGWPSSFSISIQGNRRVFTGNNLPNHVTGTFPVSASDDAYAWDRNPNSIRSQTLSISVPTTPTVVGQSCVPGGAIGVLLSGAVIYNPTDAGGRDAVAWEAQDSCQGHPQLQGQYHYHSLSGCVADNHGGGHSQLLGYALDGFGIYGHYGESGERLTDTNLDACHGHTHTIQWDGQTVSMYHYHATDEFPYVIGCFRGAR